MATGSTLVNALTLFVTAVEAESAFAATPVNWGEPTEPADITHTVDDTFEALYIGDAASSLEIPTLGAGQIEYEENWSVDVTVQVIRDRTGDTLIAVATRAEELWNAVLNANQTAPALANATAHTLFETTLSGPSWKHGKVGDGWGVRYDFELLIRARISPT